MTAVGRRGSYGVDAPYVLAGLACGAVGFTLAGIGSGCGASEDELMLGDFERVYVEHDWYDGPRGGLADVGGIVHYFRAVPDFYSSDERDGVFLVWPASTVAFALEREQWAIFVAWNNRYEAGAASPDSHPGGGGIDARYDEMETLLASDRVVPDEALRLVAEWRWDDRERRYHVDGPDYLVRWHQTKLTATA